jgi:hypothetical protein
MHCSARFALLLSILLLGVPAWAQQAQTVTTPTPAPQDPQAVSVLNQALGVAGGATAIGTVTNYSATGNVTYHWNPDEQGSVTVRAMGPEAVRVDASLSNGVRSSAIQDGRTMVKAANGTVTQFPPQYPVPSSDAFPYQAPMFPSSLVLPHLVLTNVLNSATHSIAYEGIVQVDGRSVHDVRIQWIPVGAPEPANISEYATKDVFIDTTTFEISMIEEMVPKHTMRQVRYSNYTPVNGVMVPHSVSEQVGGQQTWDITISQIIFNSGIQDSDFVLQ